MPCKEEEDEVNRRTLEARAETKLALAMPCKEEEDEVNRRTLEARAITPLSNYADSYNRSGSSRMLLCREPQKALAGNGYYGLRKRKEGIG